MREVVILAVHLLATLAKLLRPGGVRAVAAESLLLKHQLLISNRSRQRAPNLTSTDRVVLGLATLFVHPHRLPKLGSLVRPATLLKFHAALVERKYRRLFSSSPSPRRKPGPKGPSAELIAAIIALKFRNPHFGCVRIARSRGSRQRSAPARSVQLPPRWIAMVGSGTARACSSSRSPPDYEFATDNSNSLAIRSSPEIGFSVAMRRIS